LPESQEDISSASDDEAEAPSSAAYAVLMQSLNAGQDRLEPPRKKRKTSQGNSIPERKSELEQVVSKDDSRVPEPENLVHDLEEQVEADENADHVVDFDSEGEDALQQDPFEQHFVTISEQELKAASREVDEKRWKTSTMTLAGDVRKTATVRESQSTSLETLKSPEGASLKRRLVGSGKKVISALSTTESNLAGSIFNYGDVLAASRNLKNASRLRDLLCLHSLNHVFKTRDRVLKNNTKLAAQSTDALDLRDQGFTRPKVLIMVPTKQACVRFVDSIVKISEPDQQENKARFLETFSHEDEDEWQNKPDDFRELFGGNHEEDFRIGLKFTRKTIKYFSGFYNSDIIIGSPLGLMRTITTGGGGRKDKKKAHDADFLASIEVVIADHANALQMQNWQHVDYVFSQLNLLPKNSHGCDFSRVRHWYLDGQAKYLRQTIILSDFLTPEINSLASTHLFNIAGRVKHAPIYPGAMLAISTLPSLPFPSVPQTFQRIASPSPLTDSDARFKHFTTTILPPLVRDARRLRGLLLFVPTYSDFTRLRNHLSTSPDTEALSFGSVSEYTPVKEVLRARSHFLSGRHSVLLYSERAHHHFRYQIKGVRKVLWYGVPENPIFWPEIIGLLGLGSAGMDGITKGEGKGKGSVSSKHIVRALFSKWDALKLERIVGTERVGRLIHDRGGDSFEFV
jgi:U3 small nucleolar RNA-associated protein 25